MRLDEEIKDLKVTTSLFQDRLGRIWVTTQFGLYQLAIEKNKFVQVMRMGGDSLNPIRGMLVDDFNQLWMIKESDPHLKKTTFSERFQDPKTESIELQDLSRQSLAKDGYVFALTRSSAGDLCYANEKAIVCFDPYNLSASTQTFSNTDSIINCIWALYEDPNGIFWFSSDHGQIGYQDGTSTYLLPGLAQKRALFYSYQFLEDKQSVVWLATQGGVYALDVEQKEFIHRYWPEGEEIYH